MRIPSFLTNQRVPFEALIHPPAYSAQKLAKYLHVPGKQVVKGVVLWGPQGYLLAVLQATHQVDVKQLSEQLGHLVRFASADELARIFPDCEPGAVPSLGSLYGLRTVLDQAVDPQAVITFEGHTHFEAIRMDCRDYERLEQPRRLAFSVPKGL